MSTFSVVVEGRADESAVRTLLASCGHLPGRSFGGNGRDYVERKIHGYNTAASPDSPWFVLVDLDRDPCAARLVADWLPSRDPGLLLRVATRALEAWFLGDAEEIGSFLGVATSRIPSDPDSLTDPKSTLIELARHSRKSDVRKGIPPPKGSGARTGPTYASDLAAFAADQWRPDVAAAHSPSLERCLWRLREVP